MAGKAEERSSLLGHLASRGAVIVMIGAEYNEVRIYF
jgi:hypothetical protein